MLLQKRVSLFLLTALSISFACKQPADSEGGPESAEDTGAVVQGEVQAEVTHVRGPKGLTSPDLPPGNFLGEGAKLQAGQKLEVPEGTQAELSLGEGVLLRVNEATALTIESGRKVSIERGEAVLKLDEGGEPVEISAADELLIVHGGEAQVVHAGESRHYAVISGSAELRAENETIEMGPGASIDIPYVAPQNAPDQKPKPLVSLQPLEDAAWAASFDAAARMAEAVPRGVGSLTARRAGSRSERQHLRLIDQKVMVNISGRIAHTEIEQSFYNESGQTMEGIYRFPLPADASISGLQLLVGNTWMDGEMVEKQRGKRIFQQIVDATVPRDPALLHWEQGNVFKMRIFPIPGKGERKVRLSYTQVLPSAGDALRYRYPMGGSGATGTPIHNFAFTVRVDKDQLDQDAIDDISTPMLRLDSKESGDSVELSSASQDYLPTSDLGVDIPLAEDEARLDSQTHLDRDGQAYFMLSMTPQLDVPAEPRPVHYSFVLDRSHSTTPELWTLARGVVGAMLGELAPEDRFSVFACDTACDTSHDRALEATESNLDQVEKFLDGQILGGASDLGGMLEIGADRLAAERGDVDRVVVYLGDGVPTAGALATDELSREVDRALDGVRVQAVALGSRSDVLVLESIVRNSGGDLLRADPRDDRERLVRELQLRSRVPVARDVELELPEGMFDVHPKKLAGIRPGQTVTLVGRFDRPINGEVKMRARGPLGPVTESFPVSLAASRDTVGSRESHLPRTWAQEEIAHLTATEGHSAKGKIVSLSQTYTVLSRFTALIVLENDRMYREFNVARRSGNKDKWDGALAKNEKAKGGGRAYSSAAKPNEDAAAPEAEEEPMREEAKSAAEQQAPADEDFEDFDRDEKDEAWNRGDRSKSDSGAESSESYDFEDDVPSGEAKPAPSPAPRPAKKKSKKMKPSSKSGKSADMLDPFEDGGGGGGGPYIVEKEKRGYYHRPRPRPRPQIKVRDASSPSSRTMDRIARLRSARDADVESRSKHRSLVRASIYAGHADAMSFAAAWAEADPDHSQAMLSLADMVAATGDPNAMRAYASAIEVNSFSKKLHRRMASAYEGKGDLTRACSHRRALVSIDPKTSSNWVDLARCLHRAGRTDDAREALRDGDAKVRGSRSALRTAERELDMSPTARFGSVHGYPELKAVLTWSGDADLDIAFVDKRGRRLSAMRPEKVRVREERGRETLTLNNLDGAVHVEVTRIGGKPGDAPIRAELQIRTPHGSRSFPVEIDHGTLRLAKVQWNRGY